MKTLLISLLAFVTVAFVAPRAEARDSWRHRHDRHHYYYPRQHAYYGRSYYRSYYSRPYYRTHYRYYPVRRYYSYYDDPWTPRYVTYRPGVAFHVRF
jgi:hypothetical protein